jgi:hypothetical protein
VGVSTPFLDCAAIIAFCQWSIGALTDGKCSRLVLQDVCDLVQEDAGDAIVRGERAELERVTGMPGAPHDVDIRTAGEGTMFRNTRKENSEQ